MNSYLYKKVEKIAAAIHIVTNLLDDKEPLKWELRKLSLCLLDVPNVYLTKIVSVLDIASYAGLVSQMNFSIIKTEIEKVLNDIEKDKEKAPNVSVLTDEFFGVKSSPLIGLPERKNSEFRGVKKELNLLVQKKMLESGQIADENHKDTRKEIILEMLKKRPKLSIKDFAEVITDCSEKTIQRELLTLVKKGFIKKEGERRWSTYSPL